MSQNDNLPVEQPHSSEFVDISETRPLIEESLRSETEYASDTNSRLSGCMSSYTRKVY